jgi:alpha-galactosidase
VAREHPDWLVGNAGRNWGDDLRGLDLTHPGVREYLARVFTDIRDLGIDYVKLDFLYSGAIPGARWDADATPISAYRSGLELIRDVLGEDAFLLGCGAPILPSVGLVDAMRVSGDTFHEGGEDGSQGLRGRMSLEARSWQHGRFWVNDPDCLVARPEFALRDEWADVVLAAPGIRGFSDRIDGLDARGLQMVRELLKESVA